MKAVTGAGVTAYYTDPLLSSYLQNPQSKAERFLRAYKVGWFHKAERKISTDVASLDWSVSEGDIESDRAETTLPHPDLDIPFDDLDPIGQLIRLLERPNPYQTGKALIQKTQIRRDMAGTAFWYLENGDFGLPTAIYGISPSRMWESRNERGERIGWVMDRNAQGGGVPFSPKEILAFPMASADDDDIFGVGVVESVFAELPLGELMARHTGDVLTTGGRLAGMISPKDRALTEDEFADAVRAWRNVASDPNAGRRLLLFPEPMEYSAGASTPAEIGIPELAGLNRDTILTAFPIGPEMLGVPMPQGLNASGESRQQLRKFYWEDTIHPRVDDLEDVIQIGLVSRYEEVLGKTFDFEIQEPDMDDAPSLIEKVGAYKGLVSIGFDPKEAVDAVGLDHIKWLGLPDLLDPGKQAAAAQAAAAQAAAPPPQVGGVSATAGDASARDRSNVSVPIAKSTKASRQEARDKVTDDAVAEAKTTLTGFLDEQRTRITERLREARKTIARKAEPADWWDQAAEDTALRESLHGLYMKIGRGSLQVVADELGRIVLPTHVKRILADLTEYGGSRITGINEGTRDAVRAQLAEGVRRGYSINQLIDGVASEAFAGVSNAVLDNGTLAFDPYRAEVISRTETALSFNRAAISGYGEFGIREVQAIDGDGDEQCAARDGHTFTVADAYGIEDHPNGTLDWIPIIG